MTNETKNQVISKLSFEEAIKRLDDIVHQLENGSIELDKSIAIYEEGELLKLHCSKLLEQAEVKINQIKTDSAGNIIESFVREKNVNSYVKEEDVPF